MRIGLDFDNTIVCYNQAIVFLAEKLFELPDDVPRTKIGVRDYLRREGRESDWTAFQGELYGPGMCYAQPFDEAITTMQQLEQRGHKLFIVSHRSKWPYAGQRHDLHQAAQTWIAARLQSVGLFSLDKDAIHFMETRKDKINKIAEICCTIFVDDLPEVLEAPDFPASTSGILFSPDNDVMSSFSRPSISAWSQLIIKLEQLY